MLRVKLALVVGSLVAALAVSASPARAQIYSWTDANGHLVLSNRPQGAGPQAYVVQRSETVLATRFVDATKSGLYDEVIREQSRLGGVRADLVRAVVQVESGFNAWARSPKGALGLMQLMPMTILEFGVRNPFNPIENLRAGVAYLKQLLDRYSNNETLALAAYNAGPVAVDKHSQSVPPYRETRDYVTKVYRLAGRRPIETRSTAIYRTTEVVDGREVAKYTDRKPTTGGYELVTK